MEMLDSIEFVCLMPTPLFLRQRRVNACTVKNGTPGI